MTFDVTDYLQKALPGFEFRREDSHGLPGLETIHARATFTLGVSAELNTVVFPLPHEDRARKEWADKIIRNARDEASLKTGLLEVWQEKQLELKRRYEAEFRRVQLEANQRVEREVGKAYLSGKADGRAEEMAFANGEEDDE